MGSAYSAIDDYKTSYSIDIRLNDASQNITYTIVSPNNSDRKITKSITTTSTNHTVTNKVDRVTRQLFDINNNLQGRDGDFDSFLLVVNRIATTLSEPWDKKDESTDSEESSTGVDEYKTSYSIDIRLNDSTQNITYTIVSSGKADRKLVKCIKTVANNNTVTNKVDPSTRQLSDVNDNLQGKDGDFDDFLEVVKDISNALSESWDKKTSVVEDNVEKKEE